MSFAKDRKVALLLVLIMLSLSTIVFSQTKIDKKYEEKQQVYPSSQRAQLEDEIILPSGKIKISDHNNPVLMKNGGVLLVQFSRDLSGVEIEKLKNSGTTLLGYLGANTYRVRVSDGKALAASGLVAHSLAPEPDHKLDPSLKVKIRHLASGSKVAVCIVFAEDVSMANAKGILNNLDIKNDGKLNDGRILMEVPAGKVEELLKDENITAIEMSQPKRIHNRKSARKTGVKNARKDYGLSGYGVKAGVWDEGRVQSNHKEFGDRVVLKTTESNSDHSTHVAGTIAAAGVKAKAKGMANEATIYSYDFYGDIAVQAKKAQKSFGVYLSNHSYGYGKGWEIDYIEAKNKWGWVWYGKGLFGKYTSESRTLDNAVRSNKLIMVVSAGNDRNDDPKGIKGYWDAVTEDWIEGNAVGKDGPYDILGPIGVPKNVITVGATVGNKSMSSFSSWGPTDDGRLKPDVSAPGVNLYSTVPNNAYDTMSGTSMSAPVTTGSIALVMEYYEELYGKRPDPEMVKALLAVTAKDLSPTGPDYKYGFGVINIEDLCDFLADNPNMELLDIGSVKKNKTNVYDLTVGSNVKELRVCLAWLDPSGATLVNNLDLKLINQSAKNVLPWKLNPANPASAATKGVNTRDNVEMVSVSNPGSGEGWKIHVKATKLGSGTSQKYVLLIFPN